MVRVSGTLRVSVSGTFKVRLGLDLDLHFRVRVRVRVRFVFLTHERSGHRTQVLVIVTSRRYRQTNSAQALKETNRFTRFLRVRVRVGVGVRIMHLLRGGRPWGGLLLLWWVGGGCDLWARLGSWLGLGLGYGLEQFLSV